MAHDNKGQEETGVNICRTLTADRLGRASASVGQGSFTYAHLGDPLFGEYRDLGERLPKFEELAKYVFYTETSRECDLKKIDAETGFIGSTEAAGGTSYYLLYTPNNKEDRELSTQTLNALLKKDKNRTWVIYCEKIWLHMDMLHQIEKE
ncbi:MAG TPA: hypothetical protein VN541_23395, partial [Tepidisphaeraceae bacterium]|nr:hypothetical protein [Tepidisphaeraceae bacterium]